MDYGRTLLAWGLGDGEVLFPDYLNCDKAADNATASNQSPQVGDCATSVTPAGGNSISGTVILNSLTSCPNRLRQVATRTSGNRQLAGPGLLADVALAGSAEEVTQFYLRVRFGYSAFQRARCSLSHSQDGCAMVMIVESMEQRTLERIRQEFQEPDLDRVIELLASYSGPESDRVRWDILELSKGDLGKIGEYVRAAQSDYRDILYWAEYYKDDPLLRGRDPKQVVEEIIAKWGKKNE